MSGYSVLGIAPTAVMNNRKLVAKTVNTIIICIQPLHILLYLITIYLQYFVQHITIFSFEIIIDFSDIWEKQHVETRHKCRIVLLINYLVNNIVNSNCTNGIVVVLSVERVGAALPRITRRRVSSRSSTLLVVLLRKGNTIFN